MRREFHVRFCEGGGVRFPSATRLVIVFEQEEDARRTMDVLPKRFGRFGLELHPDKTRLIPFHQPRPKSWRGRRDDRPTPGSFDLLGFTHVWHRTPADTWYVRRKTAKDRLTRSLTAIREWCRAHRHDSIRQQSRDLSRKVRGHYQYYGIPGNLESLWRFSKMVFLAWYKWLTRRSQKINRDRLYRAVSRHPLPTPRLNPKAGAAANP